MTVTNKSRGSPRFHGSSGDVSPRGVVDIPAGIRNRPGAPYGRSDGISHSAAKLGSEAAQGAPGDLAEPGGPAGLPFVQIVAMFLAIYLPERPTTRIAGHLAGRERYLGETEPARRGSGDPTMDLHR